MKNSVTTIDYEPMSRFTDTQVLRVLPVCPSGGIPRGAARDLCQIGIIRPHTRLLRTFYGVGLILLSSKRSEALTGLLDGLK